MVGDKFDPGQDKQATAAIDLVGNSQNPQMYMWYDDNGDTDPANDELALRFRVDESRDPQGRYTGYMWIGLDVDTDGDLDLFLMLEGKSGAYNLDVYSAGTGANDSPSTSSISDKVVMKQLTLGTDFRIDNVTAIDTNGTGSVDGDANTDDFISAKFNFQQFANLANAKPLTNGGGALIGTINNGAGLTKDTPLRFVVASAQQTNALNGDMGGYGPNDSSDTTFTAQGAFSSTLSLGNPEAVATLPTDITLTGPGSVTAGSASTAFTLTVVDSSGNPKAVSQDTTFTLSSNSGGTVTFTPASPVTVLNGASSVTFTYTDTQASATAKTVTAAWASGGTSLGSATHAITVNPGAPAKIAFTTPARTITEGGTSDLITVELQDSHGNATTLTGGLTIDLSGTGVTFRNAADDADIAEVTIADGQSSASFRATATVADTYALTATPRTDLSSVQQTLTVVAGTVPAAATAIAVTTPARTITEGGTSDLITVELRDSSGNVATSVGGTTIGLSSGAGVTFRNAANDGDITQVTIADGQSSASFRARATSAGSYTLTAASPGLTSAQQGLTVQQATIVDPTPALSITSPGTTNDPTPTITGTTDAPDGSPITVRINGRSYTTTVSGWTWSVTVPDADALSDGTYTVMAIVTNQYGYQAVRAHSLKVEVPEGTLAATVATDFGEVAPGIAVEVRDPNGAVVASGLTDLRGRFEATLPSGGPYSVSLKLPGRPVSGEAVITGGAVTNLRLVVPSTLNLSLTADPPSILGDGISTAALVAALRGLDGLPVEGVTVRLATTAGSLSTATASSNAEGIAAATLTAPLLSGLTPRTEEVTATVYDAARGLFARTKLSINFLPATLVGVVIDARAGEPVAGAIVTAAEDFDGDGSIDFEARYETGPDGRYEIVVPRGEWRYTLTVKTPLQINDETVWVTSTQSGDVNQLQGMGEQHRADSTISGLLLVKDGSGEKPRNLNEVLPPGAQVQATIRNAAGEVLDQQVTVSPDGLFQVEGVAPGTYRLNFQVQAPSGALLVGTGMTVTVSEVGELVLETGLIDPYGIVTDSRTGEPVEGVTMKLYWADHPTNIAHGRVPHTLVELPELPDFPPGRNLVPQVTDAAGAYAWMVFADGWYYIVAEKEGYTAYDSRKEGRNRPAAPGEDSFIQNGLIYVGTSIVEFDVRLEPNHGTHLRYIQGYPDGLFRPEQTITRAEVATILTRITGPVGPADHAELFPDVDPSHWATRYIKAALARGLMIGDPDGRFRPGDPISRAEVATIALRFKELVQEKGTAFPDTAGHWAESIINTVTRPGLINGYPDGSYRPDQPITRAEFVTVINRLLNRGPLSGLPAPTFPDVTPAHWAYGQVEEAATSHRYQRLPDGSERWIEHVPHPTW